MQNRSMQTNRFLCDVTLKTYNYLLAVHSDLFSVSEAFQRARKRMQDARETLPTDLISSTSRLQIQSSA